MSIKALPDTAKPVTTTREKRIVLLVRIGNLPHCMQDGTSKMSKSAESDLSRINLLDDPKTIQNKIKRAKTDAGEGLEWGNPDRPEATNLLGIYSLCTGMSMVRFLGNRDLHHCRKRHYCRANPIANVRKYFGDPQGGRAQADQDRRLLLNACCCRALVGKCGCEAAEYL